MIWTDTVTDRDRIKNYIKNRLIFIIYKANKFHEGIYNFG